MAENESQQGIVLKTGDGTFFVRQELLDMCRVADDESDTVETMLAEAEENEDVAGFEFVRYQPVSYSPASQSAITIAPNIIGPSALHDRFKGGNYSTVMCCW